MRTLSNVIGKLPPARQQKVEARAQELIAEELTLQDIRKAQKLTQEQMATVLNIGQDSISRLEKRSDMMLSTMRSYIEAMGGSLELVARFPKRAPVIITSIRDVSAEPKTAIKRKKPKLVRVVRKLTPALEAQCNGKSSQGRGGMISKLRAAKLASDGGVHVAIVNGRHPQGITLAMQRKVGTYFPPGQGTD